MKAQMRFQKILSLITLIVAAIVIVFALAFCSGSLEFVRYYENRVDSFLGDDLAYYLNLSAQDVSQTMFIVGIVFLLVTVTLYITASNKRRKYYITNYISVGAVALMAIITAIIGFMLLSTCANDFYAIDWEALSAHVKANPLQFPAKPFSSSAVPLIMGYVVCAIVLVNAVFVVLNLVWKILLMKGEKKLLAQSANKEVA